MLNDLVSYIGLGSNLSEPRKQVLKGLHALEQLPDTKLTAFSTLYRTKPFGPVAQPDFINAVAKIQTTLSPLVLLDKLLTIEAQQGRVRSERWGPRTLDLDIILYGDVIMSSDQLTIPHPGMRKRSSVLYPLAEIAPGLILPDGTKLQQLLEQCPPDDIMDNVNEEIIS